MRAVTGLGGISVFVSNVEYEFLESASDQRVYKKSLSERQAEIARILTSKGLLERYQDNDNGIYYIKSKNRNI